MNAMKKLFNKSVIMLLVAGLVISVSLSFTVAAKKAPQETESKQGSSAGQPISGFTEDRK
jgi:hypothetical protein